MADRLSFYFTLDEFTVSQEAVRKGIPNIPGSPDLENIKKTAIRMDAVRILLAAPIIVTSGFRSAQLNDAIGGSKNSDHMRGLAVDFICPSFGSPDKVFDALSNSGIEFDQLINEFGKWVHIGFGPKMRNQRLIAKKLDGKTVYGEL